MFSALNILILILYWILDFRVFFFSDFSFIIITVITSFLGILI